LQRDNCNGRQTHYFLLLSFALLFVALSPLLLCLLALHVEQRLDVFNAVADGKVGLMMESRVAGRFSQ